MTTVGQHRWVEERLGVRLVGPDPGHGPDNGMDLTDLAGLAVRRNLRRAHLVVSRVLGKHLPVDPHTAYAAARLLGRRAAAALGAPIRPDPLGPLAEVLRGGAGPVRVDPGEVELPVPPLVIGYAETATALGHAVADTFAGARYLHSTRRSVTGVEPVGTFDEAHSHATEHLLLPADPGWFRSAAPVILVDDELTTGRTAAATIRALHRIQPRRQYVVATLLDLRAPTDRTALAEVAADLEARIDVVALAAGGIALPPDLLDRAADLVATLDPGPEADPDTGSAAPWPATAGVAGRVTAGWPVGLPEGGRHGFAATDRADLRHAVAVLAERVTARLRPDGRLLVLGTEELMYTPLVLAMELARHRDGVLFSTTTRSPVLPVDEPGYAIRTRLRFTSPDGCGGDRYAYNVAGGGFDQIVLVADRYADARALWAPDGLVAALRRVCPALTVAVLPDRQPALVAAGAR